MAQKTREEDLDDRRSKRLALGMGAGIFGLAGLGTLLLARGVGAGSLSQGLGGLFIVGALGLLAASRLVRLEPDPNLLPEASLPADDLRRALPLAERRKWWAAGAACWVGGWGIALLLLFAPVHGIPPLVRLVGLFGFSWAGVWLGAELMRRRAGSTRWPQRRT